MCLSRVRMDACSDQVVLLRVPARGPRVEPSGLPGVGRHPARALVRICPPRGAGGSVGVALRPQGQHTPGPWETLNVG